MKKLVLVGSPGANNLDIVDAVQAINRIKPSYTWEGYLWSEPKEGFDEFAWLGELTKAKMLPEDIVFCGMIGDRFKTVQTMGLPARRFETIIHPQAFVSPRSRIGQGCTILSGCMVGADVEIGDFCVLLQNVALSHDDVLEPFVSITTGATFSGRVRIKEGSYVGTNATIVDGATIGPNSMVGAGALVRHDVPKKEVWVGNPARRLRAMTENDRFWSYVRTE